MRESKLTVLAYGEGEDEKIFLRHLTALYCRRHLVSVQTGSGGGGSPQSVLNKAIRARRGEKRDTEYILLDSIPSLMQEVIDKAEEEGVLLLTNTPCLEAFFFEILDPSHDISTLGSGRCKKEFEKKYCPGNNFNEDVCFQIFPKAVLNDARKRLTLLNYLIKTVEGDSTAEFNPTS